MHVHDRGARNYLPSVVLLAESFQRFHPDITMCVLLVDATTAYETRDLPFEVMIPDQLPLDPTEFRRMATYYDVTELSTALKPTLLRHLLTTFAAVMYLDPDIELFAPIGDLFDLAREHEIVLTPHVTMPIPRDGLVISEESILVSGQFNLGFLALSERATPFLDYMEARTLRLAVNDPTQGYFTDQRWVDAVPSLFEHVVVRDPTLNVAYWNLHERALTHDDILGWQVNGEPLRFFHFSGHDDAAPLDLSKHLVGRPRVRVDREPALRRLLHERSDRIRRGRGAGVRPPYGFSRTESGARINAMARRLSWRAVCDADRQHRPHPPHTFGDDGGEAFVSWLREPVSPPSPVSRFLFEHWSARSDLQAAFPDPLGHSGGALAAWSALDEGYSHFGSVGAPLAEADLPHSGINLLGYLSGEFGVASASRLMARLIRGAGLPLSSTEIVAAHHRHEARHVNTINGAPFDVSVLTLNADELLRLWNTPELAAHRSRRRVGVWFWEVGRLPDHLRPAADLVDEIWCASEFVRDSIAPWVDRPVRLHPLVLSPTAPTALERSDLGLPDDLWLFGFTFDYSSVFARKNPAAAIDAYRRAFGPTDGAALVLKTIHADRDPARAAELQDLVAERDDIIVIDAHLSSLEMRALSQLLDCYVSLHRSEGLGLTIASAMSAGIPAIATGWSGNLAFMDAENSILVPYELREVGPDAAPYPPDAVWAEPDVEAAAAAMRRLFDDRAAAAALGARGRARDATLSTSWRGTRVVA